MGILEKGSWVVVVLGSGFFGAACSSETDASGGAGGLQCGEGTVAEGGYCVPVDGSAGGSAGASGTGAAGGAGGGGAGGSVPDASDDVQDASPDAPDAPDASEDAPETTVACLGVCGDPGCGACPTTPVVIAQMPDPGTGVIRSYGIDAFETTVAEYRVFLDAAVAPQTDEVCKWNKSYEPDPYQYRFPYPDMPMHAVDWCDAKAYCAWAGKRLCKDWLGSTEDATKSEWYNACTLGGTQEYPYGDEHDPDACPSGQAPHAPGSVVTCEGAFAGLFDMVGNMSEWTDRCTGVGTMCTVRGGSYGTHSSMGCMGTHTFATGGYDHVGIRCCENHY